jgi:hypothetical protein
MRKIRLRRRPAESGTVENGERPSLTAAGP